MNNGNLLSSLLGVTSSNTVANKSTVTKNREDTSEKFRDALEQVRPEIAAAKPRKPELEPAARKAEPATRTRDDAEPLAKNRPATRHADKAGSKNTAAEKVDANKANSREEKVATGDSSQKKATGEKEIDKSSGVADADEHSDDSSAGLAEATGNPELINPLLAQPDASVDGLVLTTAGLADGTGAIVESTTDEEGLLLNASTVAGDGTDVNISLVSQEQPEIPVDAEVDPSLVASDASALPLAGSLSVANTQSPDQRINTNASAAANQLSATINQLVIDSTTTDEASSVIDGSESEVDAAENPDFFTLLNAKTGLGKLADSAINLDKTIQVDSAKPALTASPLAEPLARLTESQSPAARSFVVQTGVPVTVGQPQWSQAVGEKVLWLAAQNVSAAEIRLDPPDLGQLHVKVSVNQDQATVTFTSPHPVVREALDQQLNRLREMFSEQGLNLVNVDVSDRSAAQQQQNQERDGHSGSSADAEEEELMPVGVTQVTNLRLVDHYA